MVITSPETISVLRKAISKTYGIDLEITGPLVYVGFTTFRERDVNLASQDHGENETVEVTSTFRDDRYVVSISSIT
jgi:hypothetical protein